MNNRKEIDKGDLASFSVNNSLIKIGHKGNLKTIKKITRLHADLIGNRKQLFNQINEYINMLIDAGIKLPRIIESSYEEKEIIFICEYGGENITSLLSEANFNIKFFESDVFLFMMESIRKVQFSQVNFDPHPKNYVSLNGILSYVDFTPPYYHKYYKLRMLKATKSEKRVLADFFKCFEPKELGFHLAADLLKMDKFFYNFLPQLHKSLVKNKILSSGFKEFVLRAEKVKKRELLREESKIYLL